MPVVSGVEAITRILNNVVGHLNSAIRSAEGEDYDSAASEIDEGRRVMFESDPQFTDLGARQNRKVFSDLYGLADTNRQLQKSGLDLTDDLIRTRRDDIENVQKYNAIIAELNIMIGSYNSNIQRIDALLTSLR